MRSARHCRVWSALAAHVRFFDIKRTLAAAELLHRHLAFAARAIMRGILIKECRRFRFITGLADCFAVLASDGYLSASGAADIGFFLVRDARPWSRWPIRACAEAGQGQSRQHHRESGFSRLHDVLRFGFVADFLATARL